MAPLPILFFALTLSLAGCATQQPGPVGPISTGQPRVDPVAEPDSEDAVDLEDAGDGELQMEEEDEVQTGPLVPPHMADREIVRAGVMLPFSHPRESVRNQAEGMLAAIELALFDHANENYVIIPHDTRGATGTAEQVAEKLKDEGADLVIGPLFGPNVVAAREILAPEDFLGLQLTEPVPMMAFSNDRTVAGGGAWLASMMPEEEVTAIVEYASLQGYDAFAFFGPQSTLGERVERAMTFDVLSRGGRLIASQFYPTSTDSPGVEAQLFAADIMAAIERGERVAVLVPERGNRLRRIAPLLAYHGVDTRVVKMLGLANWNDPAVWREPSLAGAWFPAPPTDEVDAFEARYERLYGRKPTSLAAIAYDAAALSIALSIDGDLTEEELTQPDGFAGVNGLFRFKSDGTAQRSLSIMEINPSFEAGAREIQSVSESFLPDIG